MMEEKTPKSVSEEVNLNEENVSLKKEVEDLKLKLEEMTSNYNDALRTCQELGNKIVNFVNPSKNVEQDQQPTSFEDILTREIGGK